MLVAEPNTELLVPPRTRLLHIGPMKTGTTSVQMAASSRREELLAHGVRYPGKWVNHRRQMGALMGWSVDTWRRTGPLGPDLLDLETSGVPRASLWDEMQAEIDADAERRIFISHEFMSQADDETAQRIAERVGNPIHVCVTLRSPAQIVPSLWAQGVCDDAQTEPYPEWLERFYGKVPEHPMAERHRHAYDQARLVQRWSRLVGANNVTVVIVDPSAPRRLSDSFEAMLGLPAGMLTWRRTNRSLTAPEAELFRRVNVQLRKRGVDWRSQYDLIWKGAVQLGIQPRKPRADEPRVLLPDWAADIAEGDGRRFGEQIRDSGVRVVGDLDELAAGARTADWQQFAEVPVDIAASAVTGTVMAAQRWRQSRKGPSAVGSAEIADLRRRIAEHTCPTFAERARAVPADRRAEQLASAFSTRELAAALKRRLLHKLRTRRSYPTDASRVKASEADRRR